MAWQTVAMNASKAVRVQLLSYAQAVMIVSRGENVSTGKLPCSFDGCRQKCPGSFKSTRPDDWVVAGAGNDRERILLSPALTTRSFQAAACAVFFCRRKCTSAVVVDDGGRKEEKDELIRVNKVCGPRTKPPNTGYHPETRAAKEFSVVRGHSPFFCQQR